MIGSVYRIQFRDKYKPEGVEDICYIGSTTKKLEQRWNSHKGHFKSWNNGGISGELSIFKYFKEYGIHSFEIVELKRVIICDWNHLLAQEQLAINKHRRRECQRNCVNKLPCFNPIWRQNKIDKYNANYAKNKDQILAYQNEKFTCECGGRYTRSNKLLHLDTKKHKKFIVSNVSEIPVKSIRDPITLSMPFIDDSDIILFGKYKGKNINEIISSDFEYCLYLRDRIWIQTNEKVMNKLNSNKAIRHAMIAGPHKGYTIAQIKEYDPEYVEKLRNDPVIQRDFPFIVEQL